MRCVEAEARERLVAIGGRLRLRAILFGALVATCLTADHASGCPFCTALKPSLAQRRDEAAVSLLAECDELKPTSYGFRLLQILQGEDRFNGAKLFKLPVGDFSDPPAAMKAGSLTLLLARAEIGGGEGTLRWNAVPLNETSYAYVARAPSTRQPARKRLPFFLPYLEHRDPLLAEDAYLEFGHARFDDVAEIAELLPQTSFRKWLLDKQVPQDRKGFYGMALGLAPTAQSREENAAFLRRLIDQPASDFRAGFDGMLAGYLLAGGEQALDHLDRKYLSNAVAPAGDVRHAMTALRFYHEYGDEILRQRLAKSMALLLARRQFAAAALVDLARWQAWQTTSEVIWLARSDEMEDRPTRRSVISFLLLSPTPAAQQEAARLRTVYPEDAAEAEKRLNLTDLAR